MTLYTIGFAGKSAEKFFDLVRRAKVKKIIDARIHPGGQLSGFAKGTDLAWFLRELLGVAYVHRPDLAPTEQLMKDYRAKEISWDEFESGYVALLRQRRVESSLSADDLDGACLLCSEDKPDKCHRRMLATYLKTTFPALAVIDLF